MKIIEREPVSASKRGKAVFNNQDLEPHERETVFCLNSFGFDVETIIPSSVPGSRNHDLLMLGTTWEMKGPKTPNRAKIQTKFRKAVKQSGGRAVFDLRNMRETDRAEAEETIMKLFKTTREMRRIIIIRNDERLVDILK
ncbi:hypothetical protein IKE71_00430 [Candidatus Saccharibacteria bacterium]|nr:hypothetical protein [Candidatus Saccharibacteria bacterium]